MTSAPVTPEQPPCVVATWIAGTDYPALNRDLAVKLSRAFAGSWRLFPALFDDEGVELFVDADSAEEADRIAVVITEACEEIIPKLAVTGQWIFPRSEPGGVRANHS